MIDIVLNKFLKDKGEDSTKKMPEGFDKFVKKKDYSKLL